MEFTLHFATINTWINQNNIIEFSEFTLHFATINTLLKLQKPIPIQYLHYILLLLIRSIYWPKM